jgi:hypothetical protein
MSGATLPFPLYAFRDNSTFTCLVWTKRARVIPLLLSLSSWSGRCSLYLAFSVLGDRYWGENGDMKEGNCSFCLHRQLWVAYATHSTLKLVPTGQFLTRQCRRQTSTQKTGAVCAVKGVSWWWALALETCRESAYIDRNKVLSQAASFGILIKTIQVCTDSETLNSRSVS